MTEVAYPMCDEYEACLQSGSGIPVYSETIMQRGYDVGGLFRRLASGLLPLSTRLLTRLFWKGQLQDERCTFVRGFKEAWIRS